MKRFFAIWLLAVAGFSAPLFGASAEPDPLSAVVKIESVITTPDYSIPWQNSPQTSCSGSGVVLRDKRILTNAHIVADSTLVTVRKKDDDTPFVAKVRFIDHECDLALLEVESPDFFADITPMELADTPPPQTQVIAAGYPIGGNGISLTQGIISRIEVIRYSHSLTWLLAAQIDAAINPGSSGGPVICGGKVVGIAFQGNSRGENLGYMIPVDIVRHFLKDIEDGVADGFGRLGFRYISLDNPDTRAYLKMQRGQTGVMVTKPSRILNPGILRPHDVILSLDGRKISNSGNIRLADGQSRHFFSYVAEKQIGEKVRVSLIRDGDVIEREMTVCKMYEKIEPRLYDRRPEYFIIGGFVFTKLSYSYLDEWGKNSPPDSLLRFIDEEKDSPDDSIVVLAGVLGDRVNLGYDQLAARQLIAVNGKKIRSLRELAAVVDAGRGEYITFNFADDLPVILNLGKLRSESPHILQRYQVPNDRYLR